MAAAVSTFNLDGDVVHPRSLRPIPHHCHLGNMDVVWVASEEGRRSMLIETVEKG